MQVFKYVEKNLKQLVKFDRAVASGGAGEAIAPPPRGTLAPPPHELLPD